LKRVARMRATINATIKMIIANTMSETSHLVCGTAVAIISLKSIAILSFQSARLSDAADEGL